MPFGIVEVDIPYRSCEAAMNPTWLRRRSVPLHSLNANRQIKLFLRRKQRCEALLARVNQTGMRICRRVLGLSQLAKSFGLTQPQPLDPTERRPKFESPLRGIFIECCAGKLLLTARPDLLLITEDAGILHSRNDATCIHFPARSIGISAKHLK